MSLSDFDRGLDAAFFGEAPRDGQSADYYEGYRYGERPETQPYPPQPESPGPTVEEMCAPHDLCWKAQDGGGTCYCGKKEYSAQEHSERRQVMVMTTRETVYTVECKKHGLVDLPERSTLGAWKQVARHGFACGSDLEMLRHGDAGVFLIVEVLHKADPVERSET